MDGAQDYLGLEQADVVARRRGGVAGDDLHRYAADEARWTLVAYWLIDARAK